MFFGSLAFVFEVMIYVGLGLPLINLLFGLLGGGSGSGSEIGDVDISVGGDISTPVDVDISGGMEVGASPELDVGGADFDLGDGDVTGGGTQKGIGLRFDMYSFCFALVVMGAIGIFGVTNFTGIFQVLVIAVGVGLAFLGYILIYRFLILTLKKNDAEALKAKSLQFRRAYVTFRITKDSPGKIQTKDAVGAFISFFAELDPDICKVDRIDENEEVVITEVDMERRTCYVTTVTHKDF